MISFLVLIFIIILLVGLFYLYKINYFKYAGVYHTNILSKESFQQLCAICNSYTNLKLDPKADNKRLMHIIPSDDPIYSIINNDEFINKIRHLCGNHKLQLCLDIPIEYRKYIKGSYMIWHKDVQILDDQLQYECVITLTNNSNSRTILNNWFGFSKKSIITEPNSIIIVRAEGVDHCVTKTTIGERTILKLVFYEPIFF